MEDKLIKPKELAERLGTSMDWVYRHWQELPFKGSGQIRAKIYAKLELFPAQ